MVRDPPPGMLDVHLQPMQVLQAMNHSKCDRVFEPIGSFACWHTPLRLLATSKPVLSRTSLSAACSAASQSVRKICAIE